MTLENKIKEYQERYDIVGQLCLDEWYDIPMYKRELWLRTSLEQMRRDTFQPNERILFTLDCDEESTDTSINSVIKNLQYYLNSVDITNFFVVLLTSYSTDKNKIVESWFTNNSNDQTRITIDNFESETKIKSSDIKTSYRYNSVEPIKITVDDLSNQEQFLLMESKTFCIYPWIHLHAYPTGQAYPCCGAEMRHSIGNVKNNTLKEIWNSPAQKQLRLNMLNEVKSPECARCYEQDNAGFFSMRKSANKHHGHHINRVHHTQSDGHVEDFQMTYWDIRFSNLCNLSCRSCGHIFSSSWYQDQAKLAGGDWVEQNQVLNYAGRTETDMWEQLVPHLDYVEQIYFAGGEPLMMEEHYNILEELERRGRFDVRLIYNTNFTHVKLKDRWVFDYWKKFKSVAVGASLDAMGPRAEYIRRGTRWDIVERNRERMLQDCPDVDFYISPTLSIMNAWHLPDFHRDWVNRGLIRAQDLNVNILQDPAYLRIDIATAEYKEQLNVKYQEHLDWLRPLDKLQRATVGFESAINYMMATDNTQLIPKFWSKTHELDSIRKENILDIIPELKALK